MGIDSSDDTRSVHLAFVALRLVNIVVRDWASTDCLEKSLFKVINII